MPAPLNAHIECCEQNEEVKMNRQLGAILLVAGTCVGSGMISLPIVLSKVGLIPSIILMLLIWAIMYYTSLVSLEINLQAGRGLSLGSLGALYSGVTAKWVGIISIKLLSYALLAVFLYGGASIIQKLAHFSENAFSWLVIAFGMASSLCLLMPQKSIDYINRILFKGLIVIIGCLIVGMIVMINWHDLPLVSNQVWELSSWCYIIPVVFTSFGFQVVFHTLTEYCAKNPIMLKRAFLWGSLIPGLVYILWTSSILSVTYHSDRVFYNNMAAGLCDVGDLVEMLSQVSHSVLVQSFVWWVSLLAILTSIIGVGLGLSESLQSSFVSRNIQPKKSKILAVLVTMVPPLSIALYVPNAFTTVLGFAGVILSIIAILLPVYLLFKVKGKTYNYKELYNKHWLRVCSSIGIIVISCELYNIIF